jgi:integrase/recombinase XerD
MVIEPTIYNFRKELQNLGYSKPAVDNYPRYAQNLLDHSKENPKNITNKHIKKYHEHLKTRPNKRRKGVIGQSYVYSQMLAIKLYFEYLERTKAIKRNPYTLRIRQADKKQRAVFTQGQIRELYRSCESLQETVIIHLCYGCGLRRTEAENLNIKDIDLEQKLLFVRKGKGKKRRAVPLTQTIANDLKAYYFETFKTRKKGEGSFLVNSYGNGMLGNNIYGVFKRMLSRNETLHQKGFCLHSLRHSIATHLLENEMPVEMVRDFLGHEQLGTTQIYTHIGLSKLKMDE